MLPLLLKPRFYAFKNKWGLQALNSSESHKRLRRDGSLVVFSMIIMISFYFGTFSTLESVHAANAFAYVHPSLPLALMFFLLFIMLFFSSCASSLGSFFLAKDLEFLLAAPLPPMRFFLGKFLDVVLTSTWMAIIFGLPVILAFANAYSAPAKFYVLALLVLPAYFFLPSACALVLMTIVSRLLPLKRARTLLALGGFATFGIVLALLGTKLSGTAAQFDEFSRIVRFFSFPQQLWLPSLWVAVPLAEMLEPSGRAHWSYVMLLYSSALAAMSLAFIVTRCLHPQTFSRLGGEAQSITLASKRSQRRLIKLLPGMSAPTRALVAKEIKCFARDITHTLQLILLIGLCVLYLCNFKLLDFAHELPEAVKLWWQALLTLMNVVMGAFVVIAVCARFVYPSISLEGATYWILASAPLNDSSLLRIKFMIWWLPIAVIACVIFGSGAFATDVEPAVIVISLIVSLALSYGIVGLGIGLGAIHADFDWDHSSQISASFGSLIYMLAAIGLTLASLIPLGTIMFLRTIRFFESSLTTEQWYLALVCSVLILAYINFFVTRWSLGAGAASLAAKRTL